jgi:DNA-binding LacI/PurR family transcriptional regulator
MPRLNNRFSYEQKRFSIVRPTLGIRTPPAVKRILTGGRVYGKLEAAILERPMKKARTRNGLGAALPAKPVSLRALAEYLKLSPATVSVVINDSPAAKAIPKHTKDRVLQAARKLEYRPNFFARSLSLKRGFMVGVLVPEISEGYAASVMRGIEDELLKDGYFYFVASHRGQPDLIQEYPRMLIDRAVEGLILLNTPVAESLRVPVVAISGHHRSPGVTNIVVDNKKATLAALEHLVKLGHRRIAFFKGHRGSADTEYRWKGVLRAAAQLGIEVSPELTIQLQRDVENPGPSVPEEGYVTAQELLATGQRFTALFAFNDISAIGAMRAFRDAGLRIPEDVSVVGFDDIQAAAYLTPRLTTVRQPLRQMGEMAAKQLLMRISNHKGKTPQLILLAPELVVRESTGPARGLQAE